MCQAYDQCATLTAYNSAANIEVKLMKKAKKKPVATFVSVLVVLWVGDFAIRRVSFRYASLRSSDLSGSTWWRIDLNNYNLNGYTLRSASFPESDLIGANLVGADLTKARFRGANLTRANLKQATLRGADLTACILAHAKLQSADLSGAKLKQAVLAGADLSGAKMTGIDLKRSFYDHMTKWPTGFDPKQHGATLLPFPWPANTAPRQWGHSRGIFDR